MGLTRHQQKCKNLLNINNFVVYNNLNKSNKIQRNHKLYIDVKGNYQWVNINPRQKV